MNAETFPFAILVRTPGDTCHWASEPQWAHSSWSAGAQYLRLNPGVEVVCAIQMQQGESVLR